MKSPAPNRRALKILPLRPLLGLGARLAFAAVCGLVSAGEGIGGKEQRIYRPKLDEIAQRPDGSVVGESRSRILAQSAGNVIALQRRRISELEAQVKQLQSEIEALKKQLAK